MGLKDDVLDIKKEFQDLWNKINIKTNILFN